MENLEDCKKLIEKCRQEAAKRLVGQEKLIDDIFDMLSEYEADKVIKSIKELIKQNSATAIVTASSDAIAKKFNYNTVHLKYGSIVEYNEQKEVKE